MAKRKLKAFTADDAGDDFIPVVKTVKAKDLPAESGSKPDPAPGKKAASKSKPRKKSASGAVPAPEPVKKTAEPQQKSEAAAVEQEQKKTAAVVPPARSSDVPVQAEKPEPALQSPPQALKQAAAGREVPQTSSRTVQETGQAEARIQLVGFRVGEEEFGVDIQEVQEINRSVEITPVPRTPAYVEGVVNLRGKVIPVINMRVRFGLKSTEVTGNTRIVIVEVNKKIIGMLVDSVSEVLRISSGVIEPPPDIVSNVESDYIRAVAKLKDRLVILLDLNKIMLNLEIRHKKEMQETVK